MNGDTVTTTPDFGAILNIFGIQSQRQRQEEVAKFYSDIQSAGSRERALEVVKNYSGKFTNSGDFAVAFRSVDEFYPETSKEIKVVTTYDEETGEATPRFVKSGEIEFLGNPEEVKKRFGPKATLTKPDLETFYSPEDEEGRVKVLGKLPVGRRPEGAVTLSELTEGRRARAEAAREARDQFSRERFEKWFRLAEDRWVTALGKIGETAGDKELQRGRSFLNDATRLTALSLNARMLPDGSFTFDDDNRARLFNERLRFMQELVASDPGILRRPTGGLELHTKASKALPLASEEPKPEPAPKPKPQPGGLSGLVEKVFGKGEKKEEKAPTPEALSQQINAKAKEINERTDLTPEQKKAALAKLKEIAAKNKVKVEF